MSDNITNNFFMFPPVVKYAGFYQELLSGIVSYQQLGNRLISLGERAHALRQFDKVKEIGLLLSNIPIKHYQAIGYYFLAVAANSMGNGDQDEAKRLFERVADTAPDSYKAKAILSLGALGFNRGDFDTALYHYRETLRSEKLGSTGIQAIRGIALLKSIEGYHKSAVSDLEHTLSLVRFASPNLYFDYLNSYAVELSEVGRLREAEDVSSLVVASPLARYYPEWRETFSEVRSKRKSRSTVSISLPQETYEAEPTEQVSNVVHFPTGEKIEPIPDLSELGGIQLTPMQLLGVLLKAVLQDRITDEEVDKICNTYYSVIMGMYER